MKKAIRRLRLREGDIIVVSDSETLRRLIQLSDSFKLPFNVPIIVAPEGIKRINKEYLNKIFQKTENSVDNEKAAS